MQPAAAPPAPPGPDPEPVPYPHRLRFEERHRSGIVLGPEPDYRTLDSWVRGTVLGPASDRVARVAVALASNAHRHSLSGEPGGSVRVVIDQNPFLLTVRVTDDGPRPGAEVPYPRLGAPGRGPLSGLRLVEELTVYWDWEWEWRGTTMGPLTIRAVVETP
ncbi:ATP-binding protein [Nocardiopsis sp. NPDC101807]|uniref:ATP-binding protein n=1 Tax=Nocardiopsis sp. NPDC101807 TaxID=3364339 RepID=UPI00382FA344